MSGFFGIFNRNGNPVDKKIANGMFKSMLSWNPDEHYLWIDGSVALGHAMLWNTPESKYEHLPLQKGAYVLTMDARIDNREELAKEVKLPDRPMDKIGDSEFILAAYEKWGEECPKYLLGDFAFAIWDKAKQHLFCVRDHIGIKSFYLAWIGEKIIFSNDISTLLNCHKVPKILDKNTIASFLKSNYLHSKRATFFESIKKLPPATSMIVSENEIREITYWSLENSPMIRYKTFEEYVVQLKRLYDNAVEVRLRSDYNIASHMSGGIDSSPIAVLASRKLKKIEKPLYAFNWIDIPEDENRYEYEAWNFSRRIAANEDNIIHEEFRIDPDYIGQCIRKHNIFTQGSMYYWGENYIQDQMKKIDARVMLSGWGGDELISYNGYSFISGLFAQGKIITALDYLLLKRKKLNYPYKTFLKELIKMIFPNTIKRFNKLRNYKRNYRKTPQYKYLTKEFEGFVKSHKEEEFVGEIGVRKNQFALYNFGHLQHRIESWALMGLSKKMEYRYPLLDKRIVEFAIGIPEELFFPSNEWKERPLIKNVVLDLLPADITWFAKQDEMKINQSLMKDYKQMLKIIRSSVDKIDYSNSYINFTKVKDDLNRLDIDKLETKEIAPVLLFQYSYGILSNR